MRFGPSFLLIVVFSLLSTACVQIPETGHSALIMTTVGQENQMGQDGYKEVLKTAKLSTDARVTAILKRVGQRIATQADRRDFNWEFSLIESKEMNAWCMPGGKVAVYTGILPSMQNEAAMAGVIGHEVAHAILRHSGQRMTQEMIVQAGLSVADLGVGNAQYHDQIMGLLGAGATVGIILPYSRDHESQADAVGLRYMASAGYDPEEIVRFWQRFSKAAGGAPPEFLSTHPGGATRIRDLQARLPEAKALYQRAAAKSGIGEKLL